MSLLRVCTFRVWAACFCCVCDACSLRECVHVLLCRVYSLSPDVVCCFLCVWACSFRTWHYIVRGLRDASAQEKERLHTYQQSLRVRAQKKERVCDLSSAREEEREREGGVVLSWVRVRLTFLCSLTEREGTRGEGGESERAREGEEREEGERGERDREGQREDREETDTELLMCFGFFGV